MLTMTSRSLFHSAEVVRLASLTLLMLFLPFAATMLAQETAPAALPPSDGLTLKARFTATRITATCKSLSRYPPALSA